MPSELTYLTGAFRRVLSAWPLVVRRARSHWKLLSTVIIGVLMASTILGGTFIYFDALKDLALRSSLNGLTAGEADIILETERGPTNFEEFGKVERIVDREIEDFLGMYGRGKARAFRSATFFLSEAGSEADAGGDNTRAYFAVLEGMQSNVTVLDGGRAPTDRLLSGPGQPPVIEAMIPVEAATEWGVGVGDQMAAVPFWEDDQPYARVTITGLFERNDPDNEIWRLEDLVLTSSTRSSFRTMPFHITTGTFMGVVGESFPNMDSTYGWLLAVDKSQISSGNVEAVRSDIASIKNQLVSKLSDFRQTTELTSALSNYSERLLFSKVPMFVVLALVAMVILYYVVTLASMLVEEQRSETALLRSRGADRAQILTVFVLEGVTIAVMAAVVGPMLAALAVSLLGYTPAFSDLTEGSRLSVSISRDAYLMGGLGGLFGFIALMIPAYQALGLNVTEHRQQSARPTQAPFFQRYYLDVMLLGAGILLFRQLTEQGSLVATQLFGDVVVSQLLLAVPAVVLVASAMVLLRLFPLVMNLSSRLLSRWLPAGLMLAVWQMSRDPSKYARLSLLLILTAGLGIFVASFGGTLERSFTERVLYSTGTDIRVEGVRPSRGGISQPFIASYEALPGVVRAAPAYRGVSYQPDGSSVNLFAVDPEGFADMAWFRDDFADEPPDRLLAKLRPIEVPEGLPLPEGSHGLSAMVRTGGSQPPVNLVARARDANDRHFEFALGAVEGSRWTLLESELTPRGLRRFRALEPQEPLTLVSLFIERIGPLQNLTSGSLIIDYLKVQMADGGNFIIEEFDGKTEWHGLHGARGQAPDEIRFAQTSSTNGTGSILYSWSGGGTARSSGFYPGIDLAPIPVLASDSFIDRSVYSVGSEFPISIAGRRLVVTIVDTVSYFPALDTLSQKWLIMDFGSMARQANLGSRFDEVLPGEVWLKAELTGAERTLLKETLEEVPFNASEIHDLEEGFAESQVDPLVKAGWRALLFIAFGAVLVLSCTGFLVHAYVGFRNRAQQFALLRTVGLSGRQLVSLVLMEQVLVIAAGLALGSWIGGRLGEAVMPFLGNDERGEQVLPPFVLEVNWGTLLTTYLAMGVVFAIIIVGVMLFIRRISLQRILRLGET